MSAKRIESEHEFVATYLAPLSQGAPLAFGLRDDAAVLRPPDGIDLIVTTDPIREGVHFFAADNPADVAWKALAVNASDIAAKGGRPVAYTMALGLPDAPTHAWARQFAAGLAAAQDAFGCHLVGGDTDRVAGPLSVAVTLFGYVPRGRMVPRHGARPGDWVFVSGTIGDAALGLALRRGGGLGDAEKRLAPSEAEHLRKRYLRPQPRLTLAAELVAHARSALDVSDGLLADVTKLVGPYALDLAFARIPLSAGARRLLEAGASFQDAILSGGCDYEIVAAVAPGDADAFAAAADRAGCPVACLGQITTRAAGGSVICVTDHDGRRLESERLGFDHFRG